MSPGPWMRRNICHSGPALEKLWHSVLLKKKSTDLRCPSKWEVFILRCSTLSLITNSKGSANLIILEYYLWYCRRQARWNKINPGGRMMIWESKLNLIVFIFLHMFLLEMLHSFQQNDETVWERQNKCLFRLFNCSHLTDPCTLP